MQEVSGIPDFSLVEWYALVTPTLVPPEVRAKLSQVLNDIMTTPDYGEFNKRFGLNLRR